MTITMQRVREYMAATKSPVQLVKHYDEVLQKNLTWPAWAERKEDGVWCGVAVCDGEFAFFSRTGNEFYHQLGDLELQTPLIGCSAGLYIAELVNPTLTLEELSGLVNTNRKTPWSGYERLCMEQSRLRFHDYVTLPQLLGGVSQTPFKVRRRVLCAELPEDCIIPGATVRDDAEWRVFVSSACHGGEEGAVLKQLDANWVAGHKGYRVTKLVRGLDVDLRCVGVSLDGKGKRAGTLAKIMVSYKDKVVGADLGKGWTDEKRAALLAEYTADPSSVVGRVWHIHALQEGSAGGLRLPKAMSRRIDKPFADDEV